jgi:dihydroflavonol-4-reductase
LKIALTGASGHLGAAIIPELLKRGHQTRALVNESNPGYLGSPVETVKGNLLHADSLAELMSGCDALIHCAAVISIDGDPKGLVRETNVNGTRLVLDTAKRSGIKRVVHLSSIHAYRQGQRIPVLDEKSEQVGENAFAYDRSKKAGQEIALSMNGNGFEVLVMNPTSIIGPYEQKPSRMGQVIIDLYKGSLPFVFEGGFDFCDSRDVANAVVNALTVGSPGENYILGGKWYSFRQLTTLLSKATGKKIKPVSLPPLVGWMGLPVVRTLAWLGNNEPLYTREALEAIFSGNRNISSNKAIRELGYSIRPFEVTLTDTINWFIEKGYLV